MPGQKSFTENKRPGFYSDNYGVMAQGYYWVSVIVGLHIYKTIQITGICEILQCKQERVRGPENLCAVSSMKADNIVVNI